MFRKVAARNVGVYMLLLCCRNGIICLNFILCPNTFETMVWWAKNIFLHRFCVCRRRRHRRRRRHHRCTLYAALLSIMACGVMTGRYSANGRHNWSVGGVSGRIHIFVSRNGETESIEHVRKYVLAATACWIGHLPLQLCDVNDWSNDVTMTSRTDKYMYMCTAMMFTMLGTNKGGYTTTKSSIALHTRIASGTVNISKTICEIHTCGVCTAHSARWTENDANICRRTEWLPTISLQ